MSHGPFYRAPPDVRLPRHEGAYLASGGALGTALDAVLDGVRYAGPTSDIVGVVAPHIDLHRGWEAYGHAYNALRNRSFDTCVVLGTVHEPVSRPFVLTRSAFRTPFGDLQCDHDILDGIASECGDWIFDDAQAHVQEHSIEFQTLFLAHRAARQGDAMPRIVPVLCGAPVRNGAVTDEAAQFLRSLSGIVRASLGRTCVIAAVDLAHMGPRFGDPRGLEAAELAALRARDMETLRHVASVDALAFWNDVVRDGNTRRICGLTPLFAFLTLLAPVSAAGQVLRYDQAVDTDANVVSYAAAVITA